MSALLVCPAEHAPDVAAAFGASHVLALAAPADTVPSILSDRRLELRFHDISGPRPGYVAPDRAALDAILAFGQEWPGDRPLLVHCRMGISRSTAAAIALLAQRRPDRPDTEIAAALRAAMPCATPNPLLVALADEALGRGGRLAAAVRGIGRGADYRPCRVAVLDA